MDELLEQFLVEGRELVADAHAALLALGRDPTDGHALDSLFRATHTLKGSVALFDMAPAERLLHEAENVLDTARRQKREVGSGQLDTLVAAMDQMDRWIDEMGSVGVLDQGAADAATRLIALITPVVLDDPTSADRRPVEQATPDGQPGWIADLPSRPAFSKEALARAKSAFRYAPDPECFFRGEDPLALVAAVPELMALTVLPSGEAWTDLTDWEPFRCTAMIEGLSGADSQTLRQSFRLVPDQVNIVTLRGTENQPSEERSSTSAGQSPMVRVAAETLDLLADQSGDLGVAARALGPVAERLRNLDPLLAADLRAAQDEIERAAGVLQRTVAHLRLVSLEPMLRRLPRVARETAAALGKAVRFRMSGEEIRVDKQVADQIFEPLLHLVRNAIDHGIEPSAERSDVGKAAEGSIALTVMLDGDAILVTIEDDGRGIDPVGIREAAIKKGLIERDLAEALEDSDALRLIFLPGFSTAGTVTEVSGRGVGMDAVKVVVERLSGTIAIDSAPGKGTSIDLRLPVNAITTPLLVVSAGRENVGIRLDQIIETTRIAEEEIQAVGLGKACVLRDTTVPVLDLARVLGLGETCGPQARLIVTAVGGSRTAIRVEGIGERFDGVVRAGSGLLAALPRIAGTAIRADGSVLLVLDLPDVIA